MLVFMCINPFLEAGVGGGERGGEAKMVKSTVWEGDTGSGLTLFLCSSAILPSYPSLCASLSASAI